MNVKKLDNQELIQAYENVNGFLNHIEQEVKKVEQSLERDER